MRAAQEVVAAVQTKNKEDKDVDKVIPLAIFRHRNPASPLQCSLCQKPGGRVREGALLAFKRGARQLLCHNNCAEFSPEVEVFDSKWKNVIRAVNRGKNFNCEQCSLHGATIGCSANNCFRMFHFSCAEGKKSVMTLWLLLSFSLHVHLNLAFTPLGLKQILGGDLIVTGRRFSANFTENWLRKASVIKYPFSSS